MSKGIHKYKCGKCDTGTIIYIVNSTVKSTTALVKKCDNHNCKHQYGLKELWKADLTEIIEQNTFTCLCPRNEVDNCDRKEPCKECETCKHLRIS